MDDKTTNFLMTFQQLFGSSLANMSFSTGESLTLNQRSIVLALAWQALRDAILEARFEA